jgi:hypothetical protein
MRWPPRRLVEGRDGFEILFRIRMVEDADRT